MVVIGHPVGVDGLGMSSSTTMTSSDLRSTVTEGDGTAAGVEGAFAVAWTMSGWRTAETRADACQGERDVLKSV
jgi:hypothetical protein